MSVQTQKQDEQTVRDTIRAGYAAIATREHRSCCGAGCGDSQGADALALTIGYAPDSLAAVPEGADMGLSCGNPLALAGLREGQTVLDLGSGGGFDVFQAGVKVKASGRVIGVDMTPEMLQKARRNIGQYRERTGLDNVEFRLGEIEHLPVADASIDVVLSNCVINLSPDKDQVWREAYRVLKPGGTLSVSDLALLRPLPEAVQSQVEALVGCVAGAVLVDETKTMLTVTGFRHIRLDPKPDYVRHMQDVKDPLYRQIEQNLPEGECLADYIVSLSITAQKQEVL